MTSLGEWSLHFSCDFFLKKVPFVFHFVTKLIVNRNILPSCYSPTASLFYQVIFMKLTSFLNILTKWPCLFSLSKCSIYSDMNYANTILGLVLGLHKRMVGKKLVFSLS